MSLLERINAVDAFPAQELAKLSARNVPLLLVNATVGKGTNMLNATGVAVCDFPYMVGTDPGVGSVCASIDRRLEGASYVRLGTTSIMADARLLTNDLTAVRLFAIVANWPIKTDATVFLSFLNSDINLVGNSHTLAILAALRGYPQYLYTGGFATEEAEIFFNLSADRLQEKLALLAGAGSTYAGPAIVPLKSAQDITFKFANADKFNVDTEEKKMRITAVNSLAGLQLAVIGYVLAQAHKTAAPVQAAPRVKGDEGATLPYDGKVIPMALIAGTVLTVADLREAAKGAASTTGPWHRMTNLIRAEADSLLREARTTPLGNKLLNSAGGYPAVVAAFKRASDSNDFVGGLRTLNEKLSALANTYAAAEVTATNIRNTPPPRVKGAPGAPAASKRLRLDDFTL